MQMKTLATINFITTLDPDISFAMEIEYNTISFLDIKTSVVANKLTTTV